MDVEVKLYSLPKTAFVLGVVFGVYVTTKVIAMADCEQPQSI